MSKLDRLLGDMPTQLDFPAAFQIGTTLACNANCVFCPYDPQGPKAVMSDELFARIIEELSEHQNVVKAISPFLKNEPLADPSIVERVKYIREMLPSAYIDVASNGILFKRKTYVLNYADRVKINLPSADPETYRKLTGRDLGRTLSSLHGLVEHAQRTGQLGKIRIVVVDNGQIADLESLYLPIKIVDYQRISRANNIPGENKTREHVSGCRYDRQHKWFHIDAEGKVPLCCMDWNNEAILGNVQEDTIENIFKSQAYRTTRKQIADSHDTGYICNRCEWSIS